MPCVYYNDNSCNFSKHHETKGVFYRHICSSCFAQDGKISAHSVQDCKTKHSKKLLTLGMVIKVTLQPDCVQKDCRSGDKLNLLLLDMCIIILFVEILYIVNTKLPGVCGVTGTRPAVGISLLSLVLLLMW